MAPFFRVCTVCTGASLNTGAGGVALLWARPNVNLQYYMSSQKSRTCYHRNLERDQDLDDHECQTHGPADQQEDKTLAGKNMIQ